MDTLNSLADSDSLFVNSDGSLKQVDLSDAGLMRMELLWENASPTSAFASQTINLDLSEYDAVMVTSYVADSIKLREFAFSEITPDVNNGFLLSSVYGTSSKIYGLYRILYVHTTGVLIGDAYTTNPSADSKSTSAQIPFQIYGIKGIQ